MAIRVVCVNCRELIYKCLAVGRDFSGSLARAEDFIPLDPAVPPPVEDQEMLCPYCHQRFFHAEGEGQLVLELEGGAFWPHPPIKGDDDGDRSKQAAPAQ